MYEIGAPFDGVIDRVQQEMVIDGEVAATGELGVTHIADLQDAIYRKRSEGQARFATLGPPRSTHCLDLSAALLRLGD